jgi:predicted nucleic acid-binding protein
MQPFSTAMRSDKPNRCCITTTRSIPQDIMNQLQAAALLERAYEIAAQVHIGIYDCVYVALAERENCELAAADDRITKNLQNQFQFIRHLSMFP